MRVAVVTQPWGQWRGAGQPPEPIETLIADTWTATTPQATVAPFAVPDGGPSSAMWLSDDPDTFQVVGGVRVYRRADDLIVAPDATARFNPGHLATGLLGLAAQHAGERVRVLIPVGDQAPAGDATDLWGGGRDQVARALAPLDMTALVTQHRPLLGFSGMSAALRDGKESDLAIAAAAQAQEQRWAAIATEVDDAVRADLLGTRLSKLPGSGAGAGLAYCLGALGARIAGAFTTIAAMTGLSAALADADLAVVVVESLTFHECDHGISRVVADAMAAHARPTIVMTPSVRVGRRDIMAAGMAGAYEGVDSVEGLSDVTRKVAQTWTPPGRDGW